MAIDTIGKRLSIISLGKVTQPVILTPSSEVGESARQALLWGYSGISWSTIGEDNLLAETMLSVSNIQTTTLQQLHDLISQSLFGAATITSPSMSGENSLLSNSLEGESIITTSVLQQAHAIESLDILSYGVIRRPIIDYSVIGVSHISKTFIGFMLCDRGKKC